jgi:hypothetical protein
MDEQANAEITQSGKENESRAQTGGKQMTKTEAKRKAQDELLMWAGNAFQMAYDRNEHAAQIEAMREQFQRIEKLFGYEPGSHKF